MPLIHFPLHDLISCYYWIIDTLHALTTFSSRIGRRICICVIILCMCKFIIAILTLINSIRLYEHADIFIAWLKPLCLEALSARLSNKIILILDFHINLDLVIIN